MEQQETSGFARCFRIVLAVLMTVALSVPAAGLSALTAYADGPTGQTATDGAGAGASAGETDASGAASRLVADVGADAGAAASTADEGGDAGMQAVSDFLFGVMSDPHYFPAEYQGTRAEDYQNQISGDLRLMGENEALTTGAVDQMLADAESGERALPKVLLVTGDLTSEGEKAGHEGFAEQMKRLQNADVTVLVIPGNHDLYNYGAMTFEDDTQKKDDGTGTLWTTEADFRSIYASMGYDEEATKEASGGTIESIDYFRPVEDGGIADCQGGLSYVAKTNANVAFLMIDSEVYTSDWNGKDQAWGQGAGMMSNELLEWVKEQASQLTEEGYSIVAGIHHPVLDHQATAETEFITDRVDVDNGNGMRSTDNSYSIATQLADAGIHYIFSGHMHENDVASYTTAAGNVIYDMETGGLCAYPAPYRYATLTTQDSGVMSLDLWSISVEQAAMNQKLDAPNGNLTDTAKVDVKEYMKNAMYGDEGDDGDSFITRLVMRYAARYLDQLTDIPAALENIAGINLSDTVMGLLPDLLGGGTSVDLDNLGTINISYSTDPSDPEGSGVHLNPSGVAGILSSVTIRDEDIREELQSVLDQIEEKFIANGRLEQEISDLLEEVGDVNLLNPDNPNETALLGKSYTLRQLLQDMFQRHNSGADKEPMSEEMQQALNNLQSSDILKNEVEHVLNNTLIPLVNEVLNTVTIDIDNVFHSNVSWTTAASSLLGLGDNPSIATVLDKFGLDLFGDGGLVQGLLDQYLTDSVYQQIGGLVVAMVTGFAGDADTLDDVVDGAAVQLNATMNSEPNPTVENGALPDQVSMSLDSDNTATSRQFSWYTSTDVEDADVQVIPASAAGSAEEAKEKMNANNGSVTSVEGASEEVNKAKITLNLVLVTDYEIVKKNRHTATVTVPAGDFYYRVGSSDDGYWSDPVYVDGEDNPADGYTALVVADSQGASEADYEAYEKVLAKAEEQTSGEAFALHLGDMVDDGVNENYWSWLMNTDASEAVATMPVAGNHEARQDDDQLANAIAAHYNVDIPEQDTSTGVYYSFVYGDATYIVLNTNDGDSAVGEAQKQWAASVADSADTTWKILVTHKAPYSKGSHQSDSDVVALRSWLSTFTTQHDIDLVLSGHDHTYMRTPSLTNGTEATVTTQQVTDSAGNTYEAQVNPAGTTFVIPSTSGTKFYDIVENDLPTAKSGQPYQPIYSTLSIKGDTLFWRAYTVSNGEATLYDSFAIKKSDNLTAAEKVMQMIDALPDPNAGSEAILAAEEAVNEARAAYDALTAEEQAQVSNLAKLEQLEQLIEVYQDINGKETVDLSTGIYYDGEGDDDAQRRAAFKEAIANPNVGTIILPGDYSTAIGEYSGNTLNNQYYTVDHNLVIKAADGSQGFADLRRCGFIVTNGATLVLEDVKLQAWQKKPLIGNTMPMNMIRVENGTLIANGNTSVLVNRDNGSTDGFKDESWRGHAIIVGNYDKSSATGERTVYLNTTGTISGLRDSVVQHTDSSSENDHVYINGGTYNTIYGGNSSVNLSCQLEINGGTFTKVTSYKDLVIGGGAFNGSSVDYPIWMGDDANLYVKNADSFAAGTSGKVFHVGSELHIANDALAKLGDGLGLDLAAGAATTDGWPLTATATGLGEGQDGTIFQVGQQITSMQGMAANDQGGLGTQVSGSTLSATAQLSADQTAYAYAKYHAASDSVLAGYVDGATDGLYAYSGYTMLANPRATLELSADQGPVVGQTDGAWSEVQVTANIQPNDATKFVSWSVDDESVATIDEDGTLTFKTAGQVTVTATHVTTGATATMTFYAVEPELEGGDVYSADSAEGQSYELALGMGSVDLAELPEGYTVEWSLSDGAAATVAPSATDPLRALLERTENAASELTLTATLMKDGESTGITASKKISLEEVIAAPEYDVLAGLIDVKLTDASNVGHGELASDLLVNTEGQQDSYTVSSTYRVDAPVSNPVQMLTDFVGLTEPAKIWKANVTVHAAPYVDAYNESAQAGGFEHALAGSEQVDKTVTLVYDEGTDTWSLDTGSTSPIEYQVACETAQVSFAYVGAPEGTAVPDAVTIPAGGTLDGKLPTPTLEGYTFAGWFTDEACKIPYGNEAINDDTTLYGKWTAKQAITITPDEGNTAYVYDGEDHGFAFTKAPDNALEGFTVEYRPSGSTDDAAWTAETPVDAGSYDVRVTRAEDDTYAAFEQTFEDGVKIAKAKLATPDVRYSEGETPGSVMVILQNGDADTYYWSESDDKSDAAEAENARFEVSEPGTYYAWGAGDENHEDSDFAEAVIVQVTFDDNDGAEGDESEGATFTKGVTQVLLPKGQCLNSWGGVPAVEWEDHEFLGWQLPGGKELTALTAIGESVTATAQWAVEPGAVTPAAPTGQAVAELEGISVALHGVNELHSQDSGDKSHPDVTFAASGDGVQALLADSFAVGQPAQGDNGTWTVEVTMDAQKYLDAYAAMGDPAYGAHYFANKDEEGSRTFTLAYDDAAHTWKLAEGQQAAYTFDITCLTLRPAELVKYAGGSAGDQSHFPDARVVDGQGNVYTLEQLNALLDEGEVARVAYYDEDGTEISDDTEPGVYEARIVVESTGPVVFAANGSEDASVNVNVGEEDYRFALEPSTLTVRSVSDADDAESGALGVPLLASDADASTIAAAVNGAAGGVAAQLPAGTKVYVNDREAGELTGEALAGVRLFSDELLPASESGGVDRLQALKDRAAELGFQIGDNADFQYLDLVDAAQSNLWVSSSDGATIYWKVPEGADASSLKVLHFKELHREYGVDGSDLQNQIDACTVEEMQLDTTHVADGYVSFHVDRAGFSPFVMTWADQGGSEPDPGPEPEQKATVSFDAGEGQLPAGTPVEIEVTVGGTIASLPEPTRTGYTFGGWQTEGGDAFVAGETTVEGDMELSAMWTPNEYEVTLDAAGGTVDGETSAVVRATFDAVLGTLPEPVREGYLFDGWFTAAQGGEKVTSDTVYKTAGESTYYAHWTLDEAAQKVVVTLDAGEGAFDGGSSTAEVEMAKGGSLGVSDIPEVSREGYELAGWYLDEACKEPVVFAEDADPAEGVAATVFDEDATIYAKWLEDIGSDVSFDGVAAEYTGDGMAAKPTFGDGFPASEQGKVQVLYRAGSEPWTDGEPVSAGSYDVKFVYEGSDDYAPFEKEYPAGVVITPATLTQSGLAADPSTVQSGTKLADIKLAGGTVTMADGTEVPGSWAWVDADSTVSASGTHQAVFTPDEGAGNYQLLFADVQVDVKAESGDSGTDPDNPDGSGDSGVTPPDQGGDDGTGDDGSDGASSGSDDGNGNGDAGDDGSGSNGDGGAQGSGNGSGSTQGGDGANAGANDGNGGSGAGAGSDGSDSGEGDAPVIPQTGDPLPFAATGLAAIAAVALAAFLVALVRTRRSR